MAITNNAAAGSQIRLLCMIDRVLNRRMGKVISKVELVELLRPDMLTETDGAKKRLPAEVSFWAKEGLWKDEESGLSQQSALSNERNLPTRVLCALINTEKTMPLLSGTRGQPFLMCITSLLAQDKYTVRGNIILIKDTVPMAVGPMINDKMAGEGRRNLNVTNEADTFLDYAYFLGFVEPYLEGVVMDPTRAIEGVLDNMQHTDTVPVKIFLAQLTEQLPMLDGGAYRQQVEPMIMAENWQPLENHLISASLSQALVRLELTMQVILNVSSDDTNAMTLQCPDGSLRRISTVSPGEARK
ncbi:protein DpdG [Serratia fonticola]|uniref:protein DpdG n=1 Tax=Serratia fonticola TaxID=47917 RepID=UPI0034C68A81